MTSKSSSSSSSSSSALSAAAVLTSVKTEKKSILQQIFSLSTLSSFAALFYVYFAFSNLLNLMYPLRNMTKENLITMPREMMVYPFWSTEEKSLDGDDGKNVELGMRVYLSTKKEFSLDYFTINDKFDEKNNNNDIHDDSTVSTIRHGNSFLLWSEDNAIEATKEFPSRSFVLVAEETNKISSSVCNTNDNNNDYQSCNNNNNNDNHSSSQQKSIQFATKWLEDSIQHEKQLRSDGGGIMAAMSAAGSGSGGIESTSILLSIYTSLHRNFMHLVDIASQSSSAVSSSSSDGDEKSKEKTIEQQSSQQASSPDEEPRTIINISTQNPIWKSIMSNGTAYVHVLLIRQPPSSSSADFDDDDNNNNRISSSRDSQTAMRRLQHHHSNHHVLFGNVAMMKHELPTHVPSPKRLLYRDVLYILTKYGMCQLLPRSYDDTNSNCKSMIPPWNVMHHQKQAAMEYLMARTHKKEGVKYPYWKPEVMIHLIQDDVGYPLEYANKIGFEIIQLRKNRGSSSSSSSQQHPSGYSYLPAVHVDEIGLTSDKYIPLNDTISALPLRIGFHSNFGKGDASSSNSGGSSSLSPARYRLLNHLSHALESQRELGFEQSDIDDLRRLIAETNVLLLAITIMASVLHLLFEFLTFKSDVDFWRGNTDLTGLSVRALFLDWMSQVVILFYLIEMDSSLLMTIPTFVGMLIALWKCQRGAGFAFVKIGKSNDHTQQQQTMMWYNKIFSVLGYELCATRLRAASASVSNKKSKAGISSKQDLTALTEEMDQLAAKLLGKYFLLPLVVTYAIYSLVKEQHSGWYSWFITTASSFVYAVGFVVMTPQLFLNYKLKSVAHLPWRVLGYRFVNTFIDDLFAFIIRMPTMARVSCFRDDVVFVIYLWQRYLYPVDSNRPVEGGGDTAVIIKDESGKKEQ